MPPVRSSSRSSSSSYVALVAGLRGSRQLGLGQISGYCGQKLSQQRRSRHAHADRFCAYAFTPDGGVARAVDLDHHADATLAAELDDLGHVERGVALLRGVGALLREQWTALRVEGERLLVDKAAGSGLGETS